MNDNFIALEDVVQLHIDGDIVGAELGYQALIKSGAAIPEVYNNLSIIYHSAGKHDEAVILLKQALKLNSDYVAAYFNLANIQKFLGKIDEAVASYKQALDLSPDYLDAKINMGEAFMSQNRFEEAIDCYRQLLLRSPSCLPALIHLASIYKHQNRLADAIASYQKVMVIEPESTPVLIEMGLIYTDMGLLGEAVSVYDRAIKLSPDNIAAHFYLASVFKAQNKIDAALDGFKQVLGIDPDNIPALTNLGIIYRANAMLVESAGYFKQGLAIRAKSLNIGDKVIELCSLLIDIQLLPSSYQNENEIAKYRKGFEVTLDTAKAIAVTLTSVSDQEKMLITEYLFLISNFYLCYQQKNDRQLQIKYAELAVELLKIEIAQIDVNQTSRPANAKIRLGIASEYLKNHNGCRWAYEWISRLPREDYEIYSYSLNGQTDSVTQKFADLGHYKWLPFKPATYLKSLEEITRDNLDILLIPDVGMSCSSKIISLMRLAPIQCVGWGHPVTTGSPAIDYYLSGNLMEPPKGQEHYSEELIRLPGTGMYFLSPHMDTTLPDTDFGLPEDRIIYCSVQTIYKYLPQFDYIYPAIAKKVPSALFVFFEYNDILNLTEMFKARLRTAFASYGLDYEKHVKIIPRVEYTHYLQFLTKIDVILDTIGWSGGYTAFDSLSMSCPIVTMAGEFMRGRLSTSMLKKIEVEALVGANIADYIEIAVKMGSDKSFREQILAKITKQKHKLYEDGGVISFLDNFFKEKVRISREV